MYVLKFPIIDNQHQAFMKGNSRELESKFPNPIPSSDAGVQVFIALPFRPRFKLHVHLFPTPSKVQPGFRIQLTKNPLLTLTSFP